MTKPPARFWCFGFRICFGFRVSDLEAKPMAGYSATPLAKKLGIRPGARVHVAGAPDDYRALLDPLPADVTFAPTLRGKVDLIHVFVTAAEDLASKLVTYRQRIV